MKNTIVLIATFLLTVFTNTIFAQHAMADKGMTEKGMTEEVVKTIALEQTTGAFSVEGLTLSEGNYVFEISNNGIDHEVGFVIAPKDNPDAHIKTAYVQKTIKDGETSTSKTVKLAKGEYIYFCPLNPTPQYTIVVK